LSITNWKWRLGSSLKWWSSVTEKYTIYYTAVLIDIKLLKPLQ
jgi:hypothetical protein